MKLFCVRHAHAEQMPNVDGDRPLSELGKQEIAKVAKYLQQRGVHVSHVLHSHKLRAVQSAATLATALIGGQATETTTLLDPGQAITPLIEALQGWNDDTMLIGHMPFMSQLISSLLLSNDSYDIIRFPPATIVCLERDEHRWILNWVLRPDLVADK